MTAPPEEEHRLTVTRYQRGTSPIRGNNAMHYGTRGRCPCGWTTRVNVAPSKGGRREVERLFAHHEETR